MTPVFQHKHDQVTLQYLYSHTGRQVRSLILHTTSATRDTTVAFWQSLQLLSRFQRYNACNVSYNTCILRTGALFELIRQ